MTVPLADWGCEVYISPGGWYCANDGPVLAFDEVPPVAIVPPAPTTPPVAELPPVVEPPALGATPVFVPLPPFVAPPVVEPDGLVVLLHDKVNNTRRPLDKVRHN